MIDPFENQALLKVLNDLNDKTATVMHKAIAQIFTAEYGEHEHKFKYTGLRGILCLVFDRKDGRKAFYLRMYHPASLEV